MLSTLGRQVKLTQQVKEPMGGTRDRLPAIDEGVFENVDGLKGIDERGAGHDFGAP